MYFNADPHMLQVAKRMNAEDRARADRSRLAHDARRTARAGSRTAAAPATATSGTALPPRLLGWRRLSGLLRSLRPAA